MGQKTDDEFLDGDLEAKPIDGRVLRMSTHTGRVRMESAVCFRARGTY